MFNINFYLKDTKSKSETLIYIRFRFEGEIYKRSTKLKIEANKWNSQKQRAKNNSALGYKINDMLNKYESLIIETYEDFIKDGNKPTFDDFDNSIKDISIFEDIKSETITFFEYYND